MSEVRRKPARPKPDECDPAIDYCDFCGRPVSLEVGFARSKYINIVCHA